MNDSGNQEVWNKRNKGLVALALLSGLFVLVLVGFHFNRMSQTPDLVNFTCYPTSGDDALTIGVDVDLQDGMSQDEAVLVAGTALSKLIFEKEREQYLNFMANATVGEDGIWSVRFDWDIQRIGYFPGAHPYGPKYVKIIHGHFEASVDPSERTVVYS